MVHSMFLFEVKKPEESKAPWDYYKVLAEVPGDQAFRPLNEGGCPLVKENYEYTNHRAIWARFVLAARDSDAGLRPMMRRTQCKFSFRAHVVQYQSRDRRRFRYGGNALCVEVRTVRGTLVVIDCGKGLHGFGLKLLSAGEPFSRAVADGLEGFPNAYPSSTSTTYTAGQSFERLARDYARR